MDIYEARKAVILHEAGGIGMIGVGYQRACRKADVDKPGCYSWSDLDEIQKSIDEIKQMDILSEFSSLDINLGAGRLNGLESMVRFFHNL